MNTIPNTAFDIEYSTMWKREVSYLEAKGILPSFVKRTPDYNIKVYKYTKTPELFTALTAFFSLINKEKNDKDVLSDG